MTDQSKPAPTWGEFAAKARRQGAFDPAQASGNDDGCRRAPPAPL